MKLSDYLKTTTQSAFAKEIGVSQGMVYQWINGLRPVSPDKCISIEKATNGSVTCEELLPEFDWEYLRSPKPKEPA
jgi:DNA-binding transcriptional regulator YdaS (Cro superfamily)